MLICSATVKQEQNKGNKKKMNHVTKTIISPLWPANIAG